MSQHDPRFARWTGRWPGTVECEALGIDLNEFYARGLHRKHFVLRRSGFWHALDAFESTIGGDWPGMVDRWKRSSLALRDFNIERIATRVSRAMRSQDPEMPTPRRRMLALISATQAAHEIRFNRKRGPTPTEEMIDRLDGR